MSGIYTLLSSSKALQRQLETTSNNLANVNTTGYKADKAVFREYLTKSIGQDLESEEEKFVHHEFISPFSNAGNSFVVTDDITPNMKKGAFQDTGNQFDFALGNEGFFVIQTPQGERYTRDGQFRLDTQGNLVTTNGDKVLGTKGLIHIDTSKKLDIGTDGSINENGVEVNRLKVVDFMKDSELKKTGNSLWMTASPEQKPSVIGDPSIRQGMIEGSNVNSVEEMVRLLTVNRSFEASLKALGTIDKLDENAISMARI